jgi:protein-tyrosine phosphatase
VPNGARVLVDVMADSTYGARARGSALEDPQQADELLRAGSRCSSSAATASWSTSQCARHYCAFFTGIADAANRPALIHCTTGKDRTGWAAATL